MAIDVIVPEVGEVGMDVTFVGWLKGEGEFVRSGEPIFELDTEKTTIQIEALADGRLVDLAVRPGDIVRPRQVIARIVEAEESGGVEVAVPRAEGIATPAGQLAEESASVQGGAPVEEGRSGQSPFRVSPRAKRLATEAGIDLARVRGTGVDGLITEADVRAALHAGGVSGRSGATAFEGLDAGSAAAQEAPASQDRRERSRRAVAVSTTDTWRAVPHFYLTVEADVTGAFRRLRPTVAIVAAIARALQAHPECNVAWRGDELVGRSSVDIGLLVDTPNGLLLPVIRDIAGRPFDEVEAAVEAAVTRARAGALTVDDMGPRSTTVSNLGMFAVDRFAAVITAPDPLTFAVGRARVAPRWDGSAWVPRQVVDITVSVDHRAFSGAAVAQLLGTIERVLAELEGEP